MHDHTPPSKRSRPDEALFFDTDPDDTVDLEAMAGAIVDALIELDRAREDDASLPGQGGRASGCTDEDPEAFFAAIDVAGAPSELIAVGGRLDVETLTAAYRAGCFPWPSSGEHQESLDDHARHLARTGEVAVFPGSDIDGPLLPWVSPDPRPVLFPGDVVLPRSLRKSLNRCDWETTVDQAFDEVVAACADRPETWISPEVRRAYGDLHRAGLAHSVEVWAGDDLIGGLYGVLTGRTFAGESMFHRVPNASKAAVVDLCVRLEDAGVVVIDTEQETEHMVRLGQVLIDREDYLDIVQDLRDERVELRTDRRRVAESARAGRVSR